jgi:hypothetical protein
VLVDMVGLRVSKHHVLAASTLPLYSSLPYLLGLMAMIKCSICSYHMYFSTEVPFTKTSGSVPPCHAWQGELRPIFSGAFSPPKIKVVNGNKAP